RPRVIGPEPSAGWANAAITAVTAVAARILRARPTPRLSSLRPPGQTPERGAGRLGGLRRVGRVALRQRAGQRQAERTRAWGVLLWSLLCRLGGHLGGFVDSI